MSQLNFDDRPESACGNNPKLSKELRVSVHDDGAAVLDIKAGHIFTANKVGSRILELLEQNIDVEQIAETISFEFQEPTDRVRTDVTNFIATLQSRGLLQR